MLATKIQCSSSLRKTSVASDPGLHAVIGNPVSCLSYIEHMSELCKVGVDVSTPGQCKKFIILPEGIHEADWGEEGPHNRHHAL